MAIITVNTALDSKERIQKAIDELQAVLRQKEKFQNWKPASKTEKKPSASDLLKETDDEEPQTKGFKLETY